MKNQSAFLTDLMKVEIRDSDMPEVGAEDLLIEVKHVGICGSDVRIFAHPEACLHPPVYPVILGHESAGIVVGMGQNVKGFSIGDRVAVEPGVPCRKCRYCLDGRYNLCEEMDFMACYPWKRSALSRYITHPAMMCYKLPENVSTLEGALMEPLSVGLHAAARANIRLGQTAVILGAGCIGLMTLCACKAYGASQTVSVDLFDNRLEMADQLGASVSINSEKNDPVAIVRKLTDGIGADVVFEAAGSPRTLEIAQNLVRPGGKIVMVGSVHGTPDLRYYDMSCKEIDILSVFRYQNTYPTAIAAVSSGSISIKPIATHCFSFEDVQKAFDCAFMDKQNVLKAVIAL